MEIQSDLLHMWLSYESTLGLIHSLTPKHMGIK